MPLKLPNQQHQSCSEWLKQAATEDINHYGTATQHYQWVQWCWCHQACKHSDSISEHLSHVPAAAAHSQALLGKKGYCSPGLSLSPATDTSAAVPGCCDHTTMHILTHYYIITNTHICLQLEIIFRIQWWPLDKFGLGPLSPLLAYPVPPFPPFLPISSWSWKFLAVF